MLSNIFANLNLFFKHNGPEIKLNTATMIYGYIRVSSDKQTVENQRYEINNFCKKNSIVIDGWIEETISGTKNYNKRELGKLLRRVKKGDLIICAELSRLGDDIQSKVLAFAFGLSAEIERTLISQRTKEALARKKSEGIKLGRPSGSKNKKLKLQPKKNYIMHELAKGVSKSELARKLKVNRGTLYNFIKYNIKNG